MSWNRNSRLVLALALGCVAGDAIAATLVVRSSGPASRIWPAGKAVPAGGKIVLGPTDQVTILDAQGTRTFNGPGSFDPAAAGARTGTASTIAALVSQPGQRRARIGAVRSVGGTAPHSPNLWYVEAGQPGAHCLAEAAGVTLWRPDMTNEQVSTISGGGKTETVTWLKGQSARDWPAALPVTDGAEYRISTPGQTAPVTLRFALIGKTDGLPLDTLAGKLAAARCTAQLDLIADTAGAPQG